MIFKRWTYGGMAGFALLCTGCMNWDAAEINQLGIVAASGIQMLRPSDPHSLFLGSMQVARPNQLAGGPEGGSGSGMGSESDTFIVMTGKGPTAAATVTAIQKQMPRRFFLRDRRVMIIGEDYARKGIGELLDEMMRNPESRLRAYLLMAHDCTPLEILKIPSPLNRLPANAIADLEKSGQAASVNVVQFLKTMTGKGDPYMEGITVIRTPQKKMPRAFILNGVAVFRRDRFVGWLTRTQARGFYWMQQSADKIKLFPVTVRLPGSQGFATAQMTRLESSVIPHWKGLIPAMEIRLKVRFDIIENLSPLVLNRAQDGHRLERIMASAIHKQITETLDVLQHRYDADIAGFGNRLFASFPGKWRRLEPRWSEVYAVMPVSVHVRVRIAHGGMTNGFIAKNEEG